MILTLVAWFGGIVAVHQAWRVSREVTVDDGAANALRVLGRRHAGIDVSFDGSRAGELSRDVLAPETSAAALAELRIVLSEVARDSARARSIPRAASRIALALGTAMALVEFARGLQGGAAIPLGGLASFAGGFIASTAAGLFGRRAAERASARERAWVELGAALARHLVDASGGGAHGSDVR